MLPPSADGESPAEVQRKTLRPVRANTLTQFAHPAGLVQKRSRPLGANTLTLFACPGQPVQKRSRPERANTLTQFACPGQPVQKRSRPVRANTLTQFVCPGQPVQKKEPPRQGEPACGSSRTPLGRCRKSGKSRKNFPTRKGSKNAHSHAEKTSIQTVQLAKPNRPEFSRKFLSKKCLTYWLGYANLYTWLAEAY